MDNVPPPRRSFWRFSLRELLLLMLAIAAFLGWGRAIYQRYKPFVPTPFASRLALDGDIVLIRKELGEPRASRFNSGRSVRNGAGRYECDYRFGFPLKRVKAANFFEKLRQRLWDQLDANGCTIQGSGRCSSRDLEEVRLRYVRADVEGSIRVIVIAHEDEVRLVVFVEEERKLP
jgi:hypothetical protein